jgi:hypothetical protein
VTEDLLDAGVTEYQVERATEHAGDFGGRGLGRVALLVDVGAVAAA